MKKNSNCNEEVIKIFVSMHKEAYVPEDNSLLYPIQVGAALSDTRFGDMLHDDEGDNISKKNKRYCELTTQYYAWKNVKDADYYGFWHYRRYFCFNEEYKADNWGNVNVPRLDEQSITNLKLREEDMKKIIPRYDIIVPQDWECNEGNGLMTVSEHWMKHFPTSDLKLLMELVAEYAPDYYSNLLNVLYGKSAPFCNLFIMKKEYFEEYNRFCFGILDEFEKRVDHKTYNVEQYRLLGHIAERLLAVYINHVEEKNENIRILRVPTALINDSTPLAKVYPVESNGKEVISVALACDNNYVPYTSVLLQSICDNATDDYYYDIVLMHRDINDRNQAILKDIFYNKQNIKLRLVNVTRNFEKYKNVFTSRHLTVETYYRFLILDIFKGYKKVLYMDCDMIVDSDISELFKTDISDKMIGAVRDYDFIAAAVSNATKEMYKEEILKYVGITNPDQYFQAGVILFNLAKLKEKYTTEFLFQIALSREWYYHDQDVLNHLLNGQIEYIDAKWNVYTLLEKGSPREQLINKNLSACYVDEYYKSRKNAGIIHFAGTPKPWNDKECDLSSFFWKYARKSPCYEELYKELNMDVMLPNAKAIFICDGKYEDNRGIDLFEINFASDVWSETYAKIDIMYLTDHFNKKYAISTLYVDISIEDNNGEKVVNVKNFRFSASDNDYYIKDNIGYRIEGGNKMIVYGRNVAKYEGFAWRGNEILTNNYQRAFIKTRNCGFISDLIHLGDVKNSRAVFKQCEKKWDIAKQSVVNDNSSLINEQRDRADLLQYRINEIEKSTSYKLGLFLTAIPRKIRGNLHD